MWALFFGFVGASGFYRAQGLPVTEKTYPLSGSLVWFLDIASEKDGSFRLQVGFRASGV